MRTVYVDSAASTKIRSEVLDVMITCAEYYGNPSSPHALGQKSNEIITTARKQIADFINANTNEIIFTSGGTEANNLALQGYANAYKAKGNHIITTTIEHVSVLNTAKYLQRNGFNITYLPVNHDGLINLQQLENAIRADTILISVMFANNEIGTIEPIREIGNIAKRHDVCFHTDAIQAVGHCDIDVNELNIDMLSMSGHKIYAPRGIGALYVKKDIDLQPIIYGGNQEYGLRGGTENVNFIAGMGEAVKLIEKDTGQLSALKSKLIAGVMGNIPCARVNGSIKNSLDSIVNFGFKGIKAEQLLSLLNSKGIYASNNGNTKPSHVLSAIGVDDDWAHGSVRFSFGINNTESDIGYILEVLPEAVNNLRKGAI